MRWFTHTGLLRQRLLWYFLWRDIPVTTRAALLTWLQRLHIMCSPALMGLPTGVGIVSRGLTVGSSGSVGGGDDGGGGGGGGVFSWMSGRSSSGLRTPEMGPKQSSGLSATSPEVSLPYLSLAQVQYSAVVWST